MRAAVVPVLSPEHRAAEAELLAGGGLPLPHRIPWLERFARPGALFCVARDAAGGARAGFAVEVARSRALPGHRLLRVERYTPRADGEAERALVDGLGELARADRRILRVAVELFSLDAGLRADAERRLAAAGFVPSPAPRRYDHTLVMDLRPEEPELLERLSRSARKNLKDVAKHPVEVRPVLDPAWGARLSALLEESMSRTGGRAAPADWPARIELGRAHPELSRLVGLFRTDAEGPDALLAFAWGLHHGACAHYDAAGATRSYGRRLPMAYPLLWDLALWARRAGARALDLGGVTFGHLKDGDDALGGISDFKRFFTRDVVEVGGEWVLEPRPLRARLARGVGALAARLRGVGRGDAAP